VDETAGCSLETGTKVSIDGFQSPVSGVLKRNSRPRTARLSRSNALLATDHRRAQSGAATRQERPKPKRLLLQKAAAPAALPPKGTVRHASRTISAQKLMGVENKMEPARLPEQASAPRCSRERRSDRQSARFSGWLRRRQPPAGGFVGGWHAPARRAGEMTRLRQTIARRLRKSPEQRLAMLTTYKRCGT